ncbi:putative stress-induced protein STI1 [Desarmillaria tabescens]|uniref:Stress-induced protein STI1 n=1 Tax=Armillaria tabescens TaxID=1929756 RepID=A0AA39NGX6_ARMTA|nr:putative stress-induced protein STI1 [Desarmillaria tabescens]KAK0465437.1 putative stress-induced protein STI1 [Desarmillaria tabescens]
MAEKQQRLVLSIIDFLNQSITDGTVKADDKESLEIAIQCIGEAFGVDPLNKQQVERLTVKPATLQNIFDVYLKTMNKVGAASQGTSASANASTSQPKLPTADDKARAEKLKQAGNSQMTAKKYEEAIASYTEAIALDPVNPIYYSNRAAAHSSKGDHLSAVGDAENAITVDPKYVKSYHRHAQYALLDYKAAADAFERGLKIEPNNVSLKTGLQSSKSRIVEDDNDDGPPPLTRDTDSTRSTDAGAGGFGGMADMLRNMGGGGGGMPDLASMMNNPQMMAMAQQMAANGGLANLMQNPALADMMSRVQSGNMPSMEEIMANPSLRQLAEQFGMGQ